MNSDNFCEDGYYIQYLSDSEFENFEQIIKDEFNEICCGYCNCNIQDVKEIAKIFLKRINGRFSNDNRRKIGFIGELLYYTFVKYKLPFLKEINPMLNTEENSFKKGFDMLSEFDNEIWYSEVKSGEHKLLSTKSINSLNIEKINLAYDDLRTKLEFENRNSNYWITAKFKLHLCINEQEECEKVAKILDSDMKIKKIKNKIVVSVIFGKSTEKIDESKVINRLKEIRKKDEKVIIVCIRENTINRTISIIEELANNG